MKVKELIEILKEMDLDSEIMIYGLESGLYLNINNIEQMTRTVDINIED
jgi:hypothetical protein